MTIPLHLLVNDFAIRSFRDIGDGDYIAARMACRAELVVQYLWLAQQAIEKYLKCILLLNRIPAREMRHDLSAGLFAINRLGHITLGLTKSTNDFIDYLDNYGRFRYLEVSNHAFGHDLIRLDRAVWELRRFCTLDQESRRAVLTKGRPAPKVRLRGGYLEAVIDDPEHSARQPLLWQNAFFGRRKRRMVRLRGWLRASNSPLYLNPHILDEVIKYVYLPPALEREYRNLEGPN